jgi:hypothetical protein
MWSGKSLLTFRRNLLPLSSELKSKHNIKQEVSVNVSFAYVTEFIPKST